MHELYCGLGWKMISLRINLRKKGLFQLDQLSSPIRVAAAAR